MEILQRPATFHFSPPVSPSTPPPPSASESYVPSIFISSDATVFHNPHYTTPSSPSHSLRPRLHPSITVSLSHLQTPATTPLAFTPPGALSINHNSDGTPRYRASSASKTPHSSSTPRSSYPSFPVFPIYPLPPPTTSSSTSSIPSTYSTSEMTDDEGTSPLPKSFSEFGVDKEIIKEPPKFSYRSLQPILKNYGVACLLSGVAAALSLSISLGASRLHYRVSHPTPTAYYRVAAFNQIVILLYVFGLLFFTVFQFYVFNGLRGLSDRKYIAGVVVAMALFIGIPLTLSAFHIPYQLYLIDVLLIVVVFCSLTFMIGYFGKEQVIRSRGIIDDPEPFMIRISSTLTSSNSIKQTTSIGYKLKTQRERVLTGIYYLVTEVLVSVTALVYGMFLITVYASLSDTMKIVWRLVLHPLYFEILMMLPIHYLVSRKMRNAQDVNILYTLSVVHAQMMFSTLEKVSLTVLSVLLLNIGKFFFRLSAPYRNSLAQRLFKLDVKEANAAARIERQRYIVSAAIQTEMIVENSCAIFAGLTMYLFADNKELFMFPYPKHELRLNVVVFIILVQLGFAPTLYVAQRYLHLPMLETWRDMWHRKFRFFGFLLYGLLTMGVLGILYMGFKVPRWPFCSDESVCSCIWLKWMHTTCDQFLAATALR